MSEYTKTPWNYQNTGVNLHEIYSADGKSIATCWDIDEGLDSEANARHIVHCVNNHEKLVEALENALEWIDAVPDETVLPAMPGFDRDLVDELLAALKAEKGGEL